MNVFDEDMIEDHERLVAECLVRQPEACTRSRVKPCMDGCGCDWCKEFDAILAERRHHSGP